MIEINAVLVSRQGKSLRHLTLDEINHHGAGTACDHGGQFDKMFGGAFADAIGKFRKAGLPEEMHVFDLDITGRTIGIFQQNVNSAVLAIFDLGPKACVTVQRFDCLSGNGLFHNMIRLACVDANQALARDIDEFPGVGIFAGRIFGT